MTEWTTLLTCYNILVTQAKITRPKDMAIVNLR